MAAPREREGGDPVDALTERTRDAVGPLVDAWVERTRNGDLHEAASLEGFAARLDALSGELGVLDVVAALGPALVAAELAGRYDIEETPVELASAAFEHTQLPFDEQVEFFREKLSLPTRSWTDLWQNQHDVAFVVAGAARDDLVNDLRTAVDQAIADGTTLETFRRDFDGIVAKHGWRHKGGRAWRTEVIYATNLRTSYAAGRYRQMKDSVDRRPYWRYRHSHAVEHPREQHVAWDGRVLRHDDPWWGIGYPPNGWGCQCYVEALGERDLRRAGKSGPDTAPPVHMRTVTVGATGPSPRTARVPEGIDPGWAYAPGQTATLAPAARRSLETSARRAPGVAAAGVAATLARDSVLDAVADEWRRWRSEPGGPGHQAEAFTVGALIPNVITWLRDRQGIDVANAAVTVTRRELSHAARASKTARGAALDDADIDRLPTIIARPEAVLYDTDDPALLYVFTPADRGGKGKAVVRVNYTDRLKLGEAPRTSMTTNAMRTGGYVETKNLLESRYLRIEGDLE